MSIIGTTTTYVGDEIPGLNGARVRIFGVMRGALRPNVDVDADDYFVSDVAHVRADGTASFVHCDPRAIDLACFAGLKGC